MTFWKNNSDRILRITKFAELGEQNEQTTADTRSDRGRSRSLVCLRVISDVSELSHG